MEELAFCVLLMALSTTSLGISLYSAYHYKSTSDFIHFVAIITYTSTSIINILSNAQWVVYFSSICILMHAGACIEKQLTPKNKMRK